MDLRHHFKTIWRRRWPIIAVSLLIVLTVLVWRKATPSTFRASATLVVIPGHAQGQITEATAQFLAGSYGALATTRPLVQAALAGPIVANPIVQAPQTATPPPAMSVDAGLRAIHVDATSTPGYIVISAITTSPSEAAALAQAVSSALIGEVQREQTRQRTNLTAPITQEMDAIQTRLDNLDPNSIERTALIANYAQLLGARTQAELQPVDVLQSVSPAVPPRSPISPRPLRDAVFALVAAIVIDSELAVAFEALSDHLSLDDDVEEIARITGLPVLARIPAGDEAEQVEQIRALRTNVMFATSSRDIASLAVVSVEQGCGKSFISRQLAVSMAAAELPVLLVDGDMRRPQLHESFGVPVAPGLTDIFAGTSIDAAVTFLPDWEGLYFLPAGEPDPDPVGLLGSSSFSSLSGQRLGIKLTIVDTPAAAFFVDAAAIASRCDAALIVVNARKTRRRALERLVASLRQVDAKPVGVVVNWIPAPKRTPYYYASTGYDRLEVPVDAEAEQGLVRGAVIVVNGRFLTVPSTGVQRYSCELLSRLPAAIDDEVQVVVPPGRVVDGRDREQIASIVTTPQWQGPRGHAWEQAHLPIIYRHVARRRGSTRGSVLFSPANWGPVSIHRQLLMIHDIGPQLHPAYFNRSYRLMAKAMEPLMVRRSARIAVSCRKVADDVQRWFGIERSRIAIVPPGVGPPFDCATTVEARGGAPDYCLMVGSHDRRKNIGWVLSWWPAVHQELGLRLIVTTRGATSTRFADTVGPRAGVEVRLNPTDDELSELYAGALCLLWPSRYEGFGLPLLEAMAVGTPFLATNTGAAADLAVQPGQVLPLERLLWVDQLRRWESTNLDALRGACQAAAKRWTWEAGAAAAAAALRQAAN